MSRPDEHPAWCAGGHRCNLGEHRADPIRFTLPGLGQVLLTRIRTADGRDHAEIRAVLALSSTEATARRQLLAFIACLQRSVGGIHNGR